MKAFLLSMLLAFASSGMARAQGADQGGVNPAQTDKVVQILEDFIAACEEAAAPYRPDCINHALQRASSKIAKNPGYWEANVAMTRAARSLSGLVRENVDSSAARVRVAGYRLKAVDQAVLPDLRRQGADILARAQQDLQMLPTYERNAFAPIAALIRPQLLSP